MPKELANKNKEAIEEGWQNLLHGQLEKVISSKEMTLFKVFK